MDASAGLKAEDLERRPATEADVPFLLELRRQTMTAHQIRAGVVPSDEERRTRVLVRYECAEILSYVGQPVGLLKIARDDRDWELIQLQLLPEFQGQGLGRQLVQGLVAEATAAGVSIRLSVLKGSPARGLYERLGFSVLEEAEHAAAMQFVPSTAGLSTR